MFERERSVSTYMGNYLAIPHGTNESKESIKRSALSMIRYEETDRLGRQRGPVRPRHRRLPGRSR
jgi:mannitol/fructose-specific phosphotransferase system IIA component